ncbi:nucleotidyltransferase domain-containing protein [Acidithiobacillus ferridurans]|uniref:nucleotidyltransferase domain-containing protein n=1 Tax=Acidithiobacillus ferridurans TaxID=1232575 RepID=UPI001C069A55|nr:nucleotidyltransferase domain-containing protein [Acidithiobacillus ferridurans]MBU2804336.1 nucleotidyltransferase domain-containing protein [Acidithiobacillus ferridurans]
MGLSLEPIAIIRQAAADTFGPDAHVWLFGSRVDDSQRGGDVDILVAMDRSVDRPALLTAQLSARLERLLDGRQVDVLLKAPNLRHFPIHDIAQTQGERLR